MSETSVYVISKGQKDLFRSFEEKMREKVPKVIETISAQIRQFCRNAGREKIVVGLSGGIDSAVTAWLAVKAVGKENVIAVKMPYGGISSQASIVDANLVAEFLKLPDENFRGISISGAVDAIMQEQAIVNPVANGNVMARIRMTNLYYVANSENGLVIDTCNFAEVIMGYFTRYGDGGCDFNPMGNMPKKLVRLIAEYVGMPEIIITKKPSAELSVDQGDEEDLGIAYDALDLLNWLYFKQGKERQELTDVYGFPKDVVDNVFTRIEANDYKNNMPPTFEFD